MMDGWTDSDSDSSDWYQEAKSSDATGDDIEESGSDDDDEANSTEDVTSSDEEGQENLINSDDDVFYNKLNSDNEGVKEFAGDFFVMTVRVSDSEDEDSDAESEDNNELSDCWNEDDPQSSETEHTSEDERDYIDEQKTSKQKTNFTRTHVKDLSKEDKFITELIVSGAVSDESVAKMVLRLMKEFQVSKEDALIALRYGSHWDQAVKQLPTLNLIKEFQAMDMNDEQVKLAVKLWQKQKVRSKIEASEVARKCNHYRLAVIHLEKLREKEKQLRGIQSEFDLNSAEDAEFILNLLNEGCPKENIEEALKVVGPEKAGTYLEQQSDRNCRRLMSEFSLNRTESLAAIKLMKSLKCDQKMAVYLIEKLGEKEAKARWKEILKKLENPTLNALYKEAINKLATGKQVNMVLELFQMGFDPQKIVKVADSCDSVESALTLFDKHCPICAESRSVTEIVTLLCSHELCKDCAIRYFTTQLRDRAGTSALCCPQEDCQFMNDIPLYDYYNYLGILLKSLLEPDVYALYEQKLFDMTVENNSEFAYCPNCKSGFMFPSTLQSISCPECQHTICSKCKQDWLPHHQGKTCEEYNQIEQPDADNARLFAFALGENKCPKCEVPIEVIRGGCMHITCSRCKFEFCEGCRSEFSRKCTLYDDCSSKRFHAHHPRNCFYFLRDKDIKDLQHLFEISEKEIAATNIIAKDGKCQVMEVKEEDEPEEPCDNVAKDGQMGLCEKHYKEHLCHQINLLKLDPLEILSVGELTAELLRNKKPVPVLEGEENRHQILKEMVKTEIPFKS